MLDNFKKNWKNDEELFHLIKTQLFTAVIGDVMDKIGFLNQFLSPEIKPVPIQNLIWIESYRIN